MFSSLSDWQGKGIVEVLRKKVFNDPSDLVRLMVPAGLYTVQNNLAYFAMSHLDAATYQVGWSKLIFRLI
jgi:UDP-sugar transporter A1/2/3